MTDWGVVHDACIDQIAALVEGLEDADLAHRVPATPEWTVHQVVAHMAGGSSDAVTGRMDGAPSPEWTARHVTERVSVPIADLVAELRQHQPILSEAFRDAPAPSIVWDRAVHLADLYEALGRGRPDPATWSAVAEAMAPRVADVVGSLDQVSDYEIFRAAFSRRSQRQLGAMFPDADSAQLARVGIFGPREDDQPVPGAG